MSTLFPKLLSVTRKAGTMDKGVWVEGISATVQFYGSVQPADANTVKALAPGRENDGAITIFSDRRLQVSLQESGQAGDHIAFQGLDYELAVESVYDNGLIPHVRYLAFSRGPA